MGEFSSGQALIWKKRDGSTEPCTFVSYEMTVCVIQDGKGAMHMVPSVELIDPEVEKLERMRAFYTSQLEHLKLRAIDDKGNIVQILTAVEQSALVVDLAKPDSEPYTCQLSTLHPYNAEEQQAPVKKDACTIAEGTIRLVQNIMDACLCDKETKYVCRVRGVEWFNDRWNYVVFSPEGTKRWYTKDQLSEKFDIWWHQPRMSATN